MSKQKPRGIRNNNPGNIEWGSSQWQGLIPRSQASDGRFAQFQSPAWGIRALAVTLITYYDKHRIRNVRQAINRWAPPVENDTSAYVAQVARAVGVNELQQIDFHDYRVLRPMVEAIIRHENGTGPLGTPNTWYDALTIDEGLRLAGVVAPKKSVLLTPEGAAAGAATVGAGTAGVVEVIQAVSPAVQQAQTVSYATDGLPTWLRVTLVVLTLVAAGAAGYALWQRSKARKAVQP